MYLLGPKHLPIVTSEGETAAPSDHVNFVPSGISLFLMMGKEMLGVQEIAAGNIFAIGGISDLVMKSATLSTTMACPSLASLPFQVNFIQLECRNPDSQF